MMLGPWIEFRKIVSKGSRGYKIKGAEEPTVTRQRVLALAEGLEPNRTLVTLWHPNPASHTVVWEVVGSLDVIRDLVDTAETDWNPANISVPAVASNSSPPKPLNPNVNA
jgi:hypothetical protein